MTFMAYASWILQALGILDVIKWKYTSAFSFIHFLLTTVFGFTACPPAPDPWLSIQNCLTTTFHLHWNLQVDPNEKSIPTTQNNI